MTAYEFSHPVSASRIGPEAHKVAFAADERARAQLARRYGILSVDSFKGEAVLRRESDGMTIGVTGHFLAEVTQACVTTLDPVRDSIAETFEGWYLDESQATSFSRAKKRKDEDPAFSGAEFPADEDESPISDERDDPEPVAGGVIDIGELAAQYLSLALNPYPHSAEAAAQGPVGNEKDLEKPSPFAVLKDLKTS